MKWIMTICLALCSIYLVAYSSAEAQDGTYDWRNDWAIEDGFAIEIDTEGYHFPTAIAFVPNPSQEPKAPLYFVTELQGAVKVVTNDRTVYRFSDEFVPKDGIDEGYLDVDDVREARIRVAGICLEPKRGYVFVTFFHQISPGAFRNSMVRFETKPNTFSIEPASSLSFEQLFVDDLGGTVAYHQIGPCQIKDDLLYIGIGDGRHPSESQNLDSWRGKVVRMTLDGQPVADNPFYEDDTSKPRNYLFAYGLRNPFGLAIAHEQIFAADNGFDIDRFLTIEPGENYLYNGTDLSIGASATAVLAPSIGPAQMAYYPAGGALFPKEYEQHFFLASTTFFHGKKAGIVRMQYGFTEGKMLTVPRFLLKYQGDANQRVVGLDFGPDALYFAPMFPNQEGRTPIFKISYAPDNAHPLSIAESQDPASLMLEKGCHECHSLGGRTGGAAGPPLDRELMLPRIQARLQSEGYADLVTELDALDEEPFNTYRAARQEVLAAEGMDQVRLWLNYRLQEPRFDNRHAQMPNLGLSQSEARLITDYLLAYEDPNRPSGLANSGAARTIVLMLQKIVPELKYRHLIFFFIAGVFGGGLSLLLLQLVVKRVRIRGVVSKRG